MSNTNAGKTYIDYRSSLRKVNPQQPRSTSGLFQPISSQQTPLALRQPQSGTAHSSPSVSPQQQQQQFRKTSHSVHSTSSSLSSLRQSQLEAENSQSSIQNSQSIPPISVATPSLYSQQSLTDCPSGPRTLAIVTSGSLPKELQSYLHTVVASHDIGAVVLLGPWEDALKQAKMDCYTVAGKLEKNLSVSTNTLKSQDETDSVSRALTALQNKNLYGVLYVSEQVPFEQDILDLDEREMEGALRSAISTLHAVARHTIPLLTRPQLQTNGTAHSTHAPFFALERPAPKHGNISLFDSTQSNLLQSIARSPTATGVKIGYAHDILPPPPPPATVTAPISPPMSIPPRSPMRGGGDFTATPQANGEEGMSESPTKLWASWAMAQEDGV